MANIRTPLAKSPISLRFSTSGAHDRQPMPTTPPPIRAIVDPNRPLIYVISGGQTGADQAVLRAARAAGYRTGGMAPKDYRTDEGPMPELLKSFGLLESDRAAYAPRTHWNVQAATGTVWFGREDSPGGILTSGICADLKRPYLANPGREELRAWIVEHQITTLNGAGNRERTNPGIGAAVEAFMREALSRLQAVSTVEG